MSNSKNIDDPHDPILRAYVLILQPLHETFSLTSSAFRNYVEEKLFKNFKK